MSGPVVAEARKALAQKNEHKRVENGPEFVEAYVQFTHYAEGLHGLIKGGAGHHGHP